MALGYSIDAKIDLGYNKKSIRIILEKGFKKGFYYSEFILGKIDYADSPLLTLDQAVESVWKGNAGSGLHCIIIRAENTFAIEHFIDEEIYITVMITGFSYPWLKKFQNGKEDINIARYTRLLLDIIDDFRILELHVDKN